VRSPEDEADDWIGDLGPAEMAEPAPEPEPERPPRRQPGRFPPVATLRVRLLVAVALAVAAKAAVTDYPEWETGQFAIMTAGMEPAQ
jgi:hypothetical protein